MITKIKNNLGWIVISILSAAPITMWVFVKPLGVRFSSVPTTLTSFGQITGLVGISMFAIVMILSGRFKFMENYFGGLNKIYFAHHMLGGLAFILMLFHPLFLAGKYFLISSTSAALFLLPGSNLSINFGIFSLAFLLILLTITFFAELPYEIWKTTHKFLGVALFLAGIHGLLIPSDISRFLPLKIYVLSLVGLGIVVYVYRTILGFFLIKKYEYAISGVKDLGQDIIEIEMTPKNKQLAFLPGQFIFVGFQDEEIGSEIHPFSISSSSANQNIKIDVKNLGDFTAKLKKLKKGTLVKIEGAFGKFFSQDNRDEIWVAGGIGVTPFLSMARSREKSGFKNVVHLFYCVQNASEAVFLSELVNISTQNKNFNVITQYSKEQGYITSDRIRNAANGITNKDIFICGPSSMMQSLKTQLLDSGIPNANIHSEEFQF
ncbi:MAG: ferric reductase-like transmembrane domain-containing protein [Candidatus Paceibacterota bacterium]|jgi:predicted ferric reductase